jgi:uncharacterized membrane protein YoaK (UPF0700 family)
MAGDARERMLVILLVLLSGATGLVDAASVLGLGKVFTANMTGNVVFFGFALVGTPGFTPAPYLIAIGAFLVGAVVAGRLGKELTGRSLRTWLTTAALIEAAALWIAAAVAVRFDVATPLTEWRLFTIIALTAMAMGFRNATVRQLKVPDLTTTVLTLTLTGLAADSPFSGGRSPNWPRRVASVVAIFLGAALGAFLVTRVGLACPLAIAGALVLLGTLACGLHPGAAATRGN